MALESLDGLDGLLELHIITALNLTELDVLLNEAKTSVKNVSALKCVNIISPLTELSEEQPSSSSVLVRKTFSDQEELQSHLRSSLLCQPGDYPAIKVEVTDEETGEILSLDLQPRSVQEGEGEVSQLLVSRAAGPQQLRAESSVVTETGLCQSLLAGAPLLARPTSALFLSPAEKEENSTKVSALHTELAIKGSSLVVRLADPQTSLYLLSPCPYLSRPPTFLLTAALTATDLLPFPTHAADEDIEKTEDTEDTEKTEDTEDEDFDFDVKKLLGDLPHHTSYDPSVLSSRRDIRPGRAKTEKVQKPKLGGKRKMDSAKVEK